MGPGFLGLLGLVCLALGLVVLLVPLLFLSAKVDDYTRDTPFSHTGNYLFWLLLGLI